MQTIIVVSHLLPVSCRVVGDTITLVPRKGHSSAYSGISSLKKGYKVLHVGGLGGVVINEKVVFIVILGS